MEKKRLGLIFNFIKISTLFVALFVALNSSAAAIMCVDLFKSRHQIVLTKILDALKTDIRKLPGAWLEGLDRDGAENLTNINYVRNVTQSTFWTFSSWFKNPFTANISLVELLRKQHIESIYGRSIDQSKWYLPRLVTPESVEERVQPGIFRSDAKHKREASLESIHLYPRYFEGYLSEAEVMQMAKNPAGQPTQIDGIPVEAQTRNLGFFKPGDTYLGRVISQPTVIHRYADPKYIPLYLAKMDSTMIEIRKLYFEERTKENQLAAVKLLAYYHQLFIHALPFNRVNNSIAMAQMNYLLLEFGLNPVPHGSLDIVCLVISSQRYEKMFTKWVQHYNNGLPN